jgi:hypothetical protein
MISRLTTLELPELELLRGGRAIWTDQTSLTRSHLQRIGFSSSAKLSPQADPQLIERQIYAFELVGLLAGTKKPFVFKGGTALLLLLQTVHRLSIDIDIVGDFDLSDLEPVIFGSVFYSWIVAFDR